MQVGGEVPPYKRTPGIGPEKKGVERMDKMASWKAKQEEEARKLRERPEYRQLVDEAAGLLDDAADKLCAAGEFELMDRVVFLYGVLLGFEELENLEPNTN